MTRHTGVGLAYVLGQERLIWKLAVQARPDFSIPDLPQVERGLTTTGKMELFSRSEKQKEIRNGFQFRELDNIPAVALRLPV